MATDTLGGSPFGHVSRPVGRVLCQGVSDLGRGAQHTVDPRMRSRQFSAPRGSFRADVPPMCPEAAAQGLTVRAVLCRPSVSCSLSSHLHRRLPDGHKIRILCIEGCKCHTYGSTSPKSHKSHLTH